MLTPARMMVIAAILALFHLPTASAQSAPASISNSLIDFVSITDSSGNYNELVLFRFDGTYQDLSYTVTATAGGGSLPPASGTYTYAASSTDPTVGIITIKSGHPALAGGQLQFATSTAGYSSGGAATFTYYPAVAAAGAGNVSTRALISMAHPIEVGFVIEGTQGRWVLIRGVGPSLAQFGVTDAVPNPQVTVFSNGTPRGTLSSWSADLNLVPGYNAVFALAGAFQLLSGSSDCAGIMFLPPGAYVAQGSTGGPQGEILAEVYILPF